MATKAAVEISRPISAQKLVAFPGLHALTWDKDVLYAARGYTLLKMYAYERPFTWHKVTQFRPPVWRRLTSSNRLSFRLVRDGLHALAVHPGGNLIAAVPGAIVTLQGGNREFRTTHQVLRGTRPLHITVVPDGRMYWGEYFDNPDREQVHIYKSEDGGLTWQAAYVFPRRSVRHVHNVLYDRYGDCLWVLTGDYGRECRIIRASLDFTAVEEVLSGNQQARAVAAIVTESGLYFASDTPLEKNHVYHVDRSRRLCRLAEISSSSLFGCRNRAGVFFSTMAEPSLVNTMRDVKLFASSDGQDWTAIAQWQKDPWPMKFFQYGNAALPDGENTTDILAVSTVAVSGEDLNTTLYQT